MVKRKILIIVGGNVAKLERFTEAAKEMPDVEVVCASFSDINISFDENTLYVGKEDVAHFDLIYIRMVGRRVEEATLLVRYANDRNIPIVDSLYSKSLLLPSSLSKLVEMKLLAEAQIPLPNTIFGSLAHIKRSGEAKLGYPFVIKSTSGQKAREVWLVEDKAQVEAFVKAHEDDGNKGSKRFFAQKFIPVIERHRVLVVGGKVVAGIVRPTKWRKKVSGEVDDDKIKRVLDPIPTDELKLAVDAARAVNLDIAGIDIIRDQRNIPYVIEANAAPAWKAIIKDTGINVEKLILEFLINSI